MNNTVLTGNLAKKSELLTSGDTVYVRFTLGIHEGQTAAQKASGAKPETTWIDCVAFGAQARFLSTYKSIGDHIGVIGRLETRSKETNARYADGGELVVDANNVPIKVRQRFTNLICASVEGVGLRPASATTTPKASTAPKPVKPSEKQGNFNELLVEDDAFAVA